MASFDVMPHVELYKPTELDDALELADRLGERGWLLGGGQDTYGWFKDRAKNAEAMIDLNGIEALHGIRETGDGMEIGAATTLREIIGHPLLNERYGVLTAAAARVASPQIRNVGTLGGNLVQDTRCWYYRRGLACYRAGGNLCYADSPQGMNREHCVSDRLTAMVALDATMIARSVDGEREIPAGRFFAGPATHITRMTTLEPGEILTAVRLPARWAGKLFYFEKVADRDVWDFALVSIAAAMDVSGGTIGDARFVCGGVAAVPWRLRQVENAVRGRAPGAETGEAVAALATQGARPLNYNHFKLPMMENLVRRALRGQA